MRIPYTALYLAITALDGIQQTAGRAANGRCALVYWSNFETHGEINLISLQQEAQDAEFAGGSSLLSGTLLPLTPRDSRPRKNTHPKAPRSIKPMKWVGRGEL